MADESHDAAPESSSSPQGGGSTPAGDNLSPAAQALSRLGAKVNSSAGMTPGQAALARLGGGNGATAKAASDIAAGAATGGVIGAAGAALKNKHSRKILITLVGIIIAAVVILTVGIMGPFSTGSSNGTSQTAAEDQNSSNQAMTAGLTDDERIQIENAANSYNVPWELIAAIYLEQKANAAQPQCQPATSTDADPSSMSVEQLAGEHVMVGMTSSDTSAVDKAVTSDNLNGVFLVGNWASKSAIQSAASGVPSVNSIAATVAGDREGGQIQLNGSTGPSGLSNIPSAVEQAKMGASKLETNWKKWGGEDKDAGITTTFGPVADAVSSGSSNEADGKYDRQYGSSPSAISPLVTAVVKGEKEGGEGSVVKHFPGLGKISGNTDYDSDPSSYTDNTTTTSDLDAFKAAIGAGAQVMVGSGLYTKIDPSNQAVFSKKIITDVLRNQLSFTGVVYSDELGSAKSVSSTPIAQRATKFIDAGGDVMLAQNPSDAHQMVQSLIAKAKSSSSFKQELQDSMTRILADKQGSSTTDGGGTGDCSSSTGTDAVTGGSDSGSSSGSSPSDPNLPEMLKKIRFCESGGDYTAQNGTTSASGAFQMEDPTWKSLPGTSSYTHAKDAPASVQDKAAEALFSQDGTRPWTASESCWSTGKASTSYPLKNTGGLKGGSSSGSSSSSSSKSGSDSGSKSGSGSGSTSSSGSSSGGDAAGSSSASQDSNNGRSAWTFSESKGTTDSIEAAKKSGDRWRLLMEVAKYAKNAGWSLSENPVFGGVSAGVHEAGSLHYYGQAIDINIGGPGDDDPTEVAAAAKLMPVLRSSTIGWIWQSPGHKNHVHLDTGAYYSYNPSNPSQWNEQPDCAKGMVPTVGGSVLSYSPSNKVRYSQAPPCKNEPGDVGTSSANQANGGDDASDGSQSAANPDYISAFLIPKESVDEKLRTVVDQNLSASIDWIASHLSGDVSSDKPRDITTGFTPSDPSSTAENATYDIASDKVSTAHAQAVQDAWVKATTDLKLEYIDQDMATQLYGIALAWAEGKPGSVPDPSSGDGTAGAGGDSFSGAGLNGKVPQKYVKAIEASAKRCPQLSAPLLAGLLMTESGWNPNALSPTGAVGIAQFEPGPWADMISSGNSHWDENGNKLSGAGSRTNPYDEIGAASVLLCQNYKILAAAHVGGDMTTNIYDAYNAGAGAIMRVNGDISRLTAQTQNYYPSILKYAQEYTDGKGGLTSAQGVNSAGGGTITGDASSPLALKAAQLALSKVGLRYTNNRPGPRGLPIISQGTDCSGLIMWAYWEASGEKLFIPGNTYTMIGDHSYLEDVPMSSSHDLSHAKVGDLILFNGIPGDPAWGHVGMYIGGGKIMNERNPSMPAGVDTLLGSYYQAVQWKIKRVKT